MADRRLGPQLSGSRPCAHSTILERVRAGPQSQPHSFLRSTTEPMTKRPWADRSRTWGTTEPTSYVSQVVLVVQSLSCVRLYDPTDCSMPGFPILHYLQSLLRLMSIESVMPSNHLILCHPLLLLPSIVPSIRVFSKRIHPQCRRHGFDPWVRKIPWRREWLPTPVFLPGEFHGQRSLAGLQSMGLKRVMTE